MPKVVGATNKIPNNWTLDIYEKSFLLMLTDRRINELSDFLKSGDLDNFKKNLQFLTQAHKQLVKDGVARLINDINNQNI